MRSILFLASCLVILNHSFAQNKTARVTGTVQSTDRLPVESATVFLLNASDSVMVKTAISDQHGTFMMNRIKPGTYLIKISALGWSDYYSGTFEADSNGRDTFLAPYYLQPAQNRLAGVTIMTQRPFVERKIDKLVVNVASSPVNAGKSALDVLAQSPGVTIDENDNIILSGKSTVSVFIDGKLNYLAGKELASFLRALPASQLDQLEIMTQPSSKYDAAGDGGVINLKTRQNRTNGFNGSLTSSATFSYYLKASGSLVFNLKKNRFNFSLNYNPGYRKNYNNQVFDRSYRSDYSIPFNGYQNQQARLVFTQVPSITKLSADYTLSKSTTLGMTVVTNLTRDQQAMSGRIHLSDSLRAPTGNTDYQMDYTDHIFNPSLNLNLQHRINDSKQIDFSGDFVSFKKTAVQTTDNLTQDFIHNQTNHLLELNEAPMDVVIESLKADYSQTVNSNTKFETGIKTSLVTTDNDNHYSIFNSTSQQFEPDNSRSNHFVYKENILAAYVSVTTQLSKQWGLQAGVRAEETVSAGHEKVQGDQFRREYLKLFPTLYLNYTASQSNSFSLNYGRRLNRPNYSNVNPFRYFQDRFYYYSGNPNLLPITTDNVELSYNYKGQINVKINYTITHHVWSNLYTVTIEGNDHILHQMMENAAERKNIGIALDCNKKVTRWWNINSTVNFFHNEMNGWLDGKQVSASNFTLIANVSNQFNLSKTLSLDLTAFYRTPRLESFPVYSIAGGSFSLGASKKLSQKASITADINDPLNLFSGGQVSDRQTFVMRNVNKPENRYVVLTYSYRFGKTLEQNRKHASAAQDEINRL